jgi:hypothetical protein
LFERDLVIFKWNVEVLQEDAYLFAASIQGEVVENGFAGWWRNCLGFLYGCRYLSWLLSGRGYYYLLYYFDFFHWFLYFGRINWFHIFDFSLLFLGFRRSNWYHDLWILRNWIGRLFSRKWVSRGNSFRRGLGYLRCRHGRGKWIR